MNYIHNRGAGFNGQDFRNNSHSFFNNTPQYEGVTLLLRAILAQTMRAVITGVITKREIIINDRTIVGSFRTACIIAMKMLTPKTRVSYSGGSLQAVRLMHDGEIQEAHRAE